MDADPGTLAFTNVVSFAGGGVTLVSIDADVAKESAPRPFVPFSAHARRQTRA